MGTVMDEMKPVALVVTPVTASAGVCCMAATCAPKLDRMSERMDDLHVTAVKHEATLEEHIRRTALAEESIVMLRAELSPLKTHIAVTGAIAKVVVVLGAVVSAVYTTGKMLGRF